MGSILEQLATVMTMLVHSRSPLGSMIHEHQQQKLYLKRVDALWAADGIGGLACS